jgi:hypothetical protein
MPIRLCPGLCRMLISLCRGLGRVLIRLCQSLGRVLIGLCRGLWTGALLSVGHFLGAPDLGPWTLGGRSMIGDGRRFGGGKWLARAIESERKVSKVDAIYRGPCQVPRQALWNSSRLEAVLSAVWRRLAGRRAWAAPSCVALVGGSAGCWS